MTIGKILTAFYRPIPVLVTCVLIAYAYSFVVLRVKHASQIHATKDAVFVYSALDLEGAATAKQLMKETTLEVIQVEAQGSEKRIRQLGFGSDLIVPALLLPNGSTYAVVTDKRIVSQVISPLFGGHTAFSKGTVTLLLALGMWLLFSFWWRFMGYFGPLWPAMGAVVLGLAVPNCPQCQGSTDFVWVPWLGLISFTMALVAFMAGRNRLRWIVWLLLLMSAFGAILQAVILTLEPKACPLCVVAAAAAAGTFCTCRMLLEESALRCIAFPKWVSATVLACSFFAAGRQALAPPVQASESKNYGSCLGKQLSDYVSHCPALKRKELVLVSLSQCGACEKAKEDMISGQVPFREFPYQTILGSESTFKADFSEVAPLLLLCDSTGKILQAEAGWPTEPEEKRELLKSYRRSLGGDDVSKN